MFTPRQPDADSSVTLDSASIIQFVNSVKDVLALDSNFIGLTPLNDVFAAGSSSNEDVVAISSIGGHPFGSWQAHGGDKRFMWFT